MKNFFASGRFIAAGLLFFLGATPFAAEIPLVDKTLVVWAAPANVTQRGGSVLTLEDPAAHFDAIVFGELKEKRWMAGSDFFSRTLREQESLSPETAVGTLLQIAIAYRGPEIIVYRNGQEYSRHSIQQPQIFDESSFVLIGPRHRGQGSFFVGEVEDARVYASALDGQQIAALRPNAEGPFKPWAWWTFNEAPGTDRMGRFPHTQLSGGAEVRNGRLILNKTGAAFMATRRPAPKDADESALNFHLMHPGGDSLPGDPNAAFYLAGLYHLHYILAHPWNGGQSFSFVHVTSPDMLHWTWQPTRLQPSFTGHGMFSGTGFLTKEGRPAAIYHGQASGKNQIAIGMDRKLTSWEKPYPIQVKNKDGTEAKISHWDPDCFLIGDTYYAISGGENPPLMKSRDLRNWTLVGDFLQHDLPDVARGEDISCPNFFPIGDKWMLLCISHDLGCRYYIGDWDKNAEQFVPQKHRRMNFRREGQSFFSRQNWRVDFFAPESVLAADGRRVMWAWCATLDRDDGRMSAKTIESLPRELSLPADGVLRIKPLRELGTLRYDPVVLENVDLGDALRDLRADRLPAGKLRVDLPGDSLEIRISIPRDQAERKLFGFSLFPDGKGGGLPIMFRPETSALRVGSAEAPFAISDLPRGEDIDLHIFIDKYVVEVFVNDRQAMIAAHHGYAANPVLSGFTIGAPTIVKKIEMWKLRPANEGFLNARTNRVWEPQTRSN